MTTIPPKPVKLLKYPCYQCNAKERFNENEPLCRDCLSKNKGELEAHKQKLLDAAAEAVLADVDRRWRSFIMQNQHLSDFEEFTADLIDTSTEIYKDSSAYCKAYAVNTYNNGRGAMFIGDYTDTALCYALYTMRRILTKHQRYDTGLVSFDYTHYADCIPNVFGSPTESLYSTSGLLVVDSVNFETMIENKHETRAFTAFLKYRFETRRPTFMVVENAYNQLPKELNSYLNRAFAAKLYARKS